MDDKRIQFLENASQLFMRLGFKSLTMDDIARELGISKKTLYQYFEDKNDLVKQGVKNHLCQNQELIQNGCRNAKNAIEEIFQVMNCVQMQLKNSHPSILFDLKKYHPEAFALINEHKKSFVKQVIQNNIERGKNEGLYKQDINSDVISTIYISRIDLLFDTDFFPREKYDFSDVYNELIKYHLYAISSNKGLKQLKKYLNNRINEPKK